MEVCINKRKHSNYKLRTQTNRVCHGGAGNQLRAWANEAPLTDASLKTEISGVDQKEGGGGEAGNSIAPPRLLSPLRKLLTLYLKSRPRGETLNRAGATTVITLCNVNCEQSPGQVSSCAGFRRLLQVFLTDVQLVSKKPKT